MGGGVSRTTLSIVNCVLRTGGAKLMSQYVDAVSRPIEVDYQQKTLGSYGFSWSKPSAVS